MAGPQVITLTLVAACATIGAWWCDLREGKLARNLRKWLTENHPHVWEELPWMHRKLLPPRAGLRLIVRQKKVVDEEFHDQYESVRKLERRKMLLVFLGVSMICLVIAGTRILGWKW
jgi:hypothetical protein